MDPTLYKRNDTSKSLFNPLDRDIEVEYRDDSNQVETIVIPSLKISTYPSYKADILLNHIVTSVANDRNMGYITPEKKQELEKEIVI